MKSSEDVVKECFEALDAETVANAVTDISASLEKYKNLERAVATSFVLKTIFMNIPKKAQIEGKIMMESILQATYKEVIAHWKSQGESDFFPNSAQVQDF